MLKICEKGIIDQEISYTSAPLQLKGFVLNKSHNKGLIILQS